ncbi:ATP-dependent bile acid permease [Paramyrothecium foliicola]|nr:ATP-dependent bile acid permease [Paramyrothecium foliicola]
MGKPPSKGDARPEPEPSPLGESSASISLHNTNPPIQRYFDDDPAELQADDLPPLYSDHEERPAGPINPLMPEGMPHDMQYLVKDQKTGSEYYINSRLESDPKFLEQHLRALARLPPRPTVHLRGTHHETVKNGDRSERREMVDFDVTIDLTYLLLKDIFNDPAWHDIRTVGNLEKVRRGTIFATRAPGFGGSGEPETGVPGVEEWCHRFCASHAGLKNFVFERRVLGWDWDALRARLEELVRATNYRGHLRVEFPLRNATSEVYNDCRTNRWRLKVWVQWLFMFTLLFLVAWPWLLLRTRRWETVYADWHLSRTDERGDHRYASVSEHQWYNMWARAIQRAVLSRRQGALTQAELAEGGGDEPPRSNSALAGWVQAGVEAMGVVDRSFGWGMDSYPFPGQQEHSRIDTVNGMADITNPRRILAVSLEESTQHLSSVIKDLTGSTPEPASTSLAGTTHDLNIKTAYYSATVPVWLDLISSPEEWAESFLSEEAGEVLAVLGGLVVVFALPTTSEAAERTRSLVKHVGRVVKEGLGGWEWDGVGLAVGVGEGDVDEWDGLAADAGLEFVQARQAGSKNEQRNEFGEKTGVPRVREALESNDWAQLDSGQDLSDFGDFNEAEEKDDKDLDPENLDFGFDRADFEGMRKAIWSLVDNVEEPATTETNQNAAAQDKTTDKEAGGVPTEDQVAKVEMMMQKLQATREAGEGMSQEQRRRMAARAVEEVMRDL